MIEGFRKKMRARRISNAIEESIKDGVGLHHQQWMTESPFDDDSFLGVADEIVEWCKQTMAQTKRPHGIDHMAVAVACAHPGDDPVASATFGVFRPADFYRSGGIGDSLATFVSGIDRSVFDVSRPIRFAAALFSWGDVARATVFKDG